LHQFVILIVNEVKPVSLLIVNEGMFLSIAEAGSDWESYAEFMARKIDPEKLTVSYLEGLREIFWW
jgi:hypothetical protein